MQLSSWDTQLVWYGATTCAYNSATEVGDAVGDGNGAQVGKAVGLVDDGLAVGTADGAEVAGEADGARVAPGTVGVEVEGGTVGKLDGDVVGVVVGATDGAAVGIVVGEPDGEIDGEIVGTAVVGMSDGEIDGTDVVGFRVGGSEHAPQHASAQNAMKLCSGEQHLLDRAMAPHTSSPSKGSFVTPGQVLGEVVGELDGVPVSSEKVGSEVVGSEVVGSEVGAVVGSEAVGSAVGTRVGAEVVGASVGGDRWRRGRHRRRGTRWRD